MKIKGEKRGNRIHQIVAIIFLPAKHVDRLSLVATLITS